MKPERYAAPVILMIFVLCMTLAGCRRVPVTAQPTAVPQVTSTSRATATPPPTVASQPTATSPPAHTSLPPAAEPLTTGTAGLPWWNDRVFYEVFVRSYYDSDGDGIGDLQGLIEKLDYLNDGDPDTDGDLGITGIWLMPVAQSPSYHGYDVIDYRTVEEDYGTNDDFLRLMEAAHERGIVVIVDLVLNHTSNQHPWFQDARTPGSDHDDWYIWAEKPPFLLGPWTQIVWHRAGDRFYYGLFWEGMPDLNYENDAVTGEMYDITRFWLEDMGVDGFRLDAVRHLIEEGQIQENTAATHTWLEGFYGYVHGLVPDALLVGEVWTSSAEVAKYIGDEVDVAFEFDLAQAVLDSLLRANSRELVQTQQWVLDLYPQGQYAAFLTNHDQNRVMNQLRKDTGASKVAATLLLTNPGLPFIYYGEELGMLGSKPDERIRTPMQWDGSETAGFTTGTPWERLADGHDVANVADQAGDPASLLNHYRSLIRLRKDHPALRAGELLLLDSDDPAVYGFLRSTTEETILVVVNLSDEGVNDYALTLDAGPLLGTETATILLGEGEVVAMEVNASGGFEGYRPVATLASHGSLILLLGP